MSQSDIQQQRMKGYFIEAAKKLIFENTPDQISVRKVAAEAGYSYATIYNYFDDINHLLWYVIVDIFDALAQKITPILNDPAGSQREKIQSAALAYVDYFLENPNAFKLLFVSPPGEPPRDIVPKLRQPSIEEVIKSSIEKAITDPQRADTVGNLLSSALHGYLLFCISLGQLTHDQLRERVIHSVQLLIHEE